MVVQFLGMNFKLIVHFATTPKTTHILLPLDYSVNLYLYLFINLLGAIFTYHYFCKAISLLFKPSPHNFPTLRYVFTTSTKNKSHFYDI